MKISLKVGGLININDLNYNKKRLRELSDNKYIKNDTRTSTNITTFTLYDPLSITDDYFQRSHQEYHLIIFPESILKNSTNSYLYNTISKLFEDGMNIIDIHAYISL